MALGTKQPRAMVLCLAVAWLAGTGCSRIAAIGSSYPKCVNNLLKIGLALHEHHDELGSFPKAAISDKEGRPGLSWRVAILPFLGQKSLYDRFKLDEPWDSPNNKPLLAEMPEVFACPGTSRKDPSLTNYRAFAGHGAFLEPAYDKRLEKVWWVGDDGEKHYYGEPRSGTRIADFMDGPANTLMVVEAKVSVPWTKPDELPFDPEHPSGPLFGAGSPHRGGFNAVFVDASVWFLPNTISPDLFRSLITRAGGEIVSLDRPSTIQASKEEPHRPDLEIKKESERAMYK
jgi:Protein of unknown function (DUF1559)